MPIIQDRRKKRYFCTFVKKNKHKQYKGNVVVIAAHNEILAKEALCEQYDIPPTKVEPNFLGEYKSEGVVTIRLAETNIYEGGTIYDNLRDDQ